MSKPAIEQYQGQPTLCLNPEARYKFSFGIAKAKMILEHLAEIQAFVASEGISCLPQPDPPVQQEPSLSFLQKYAGDQIGQRDAMLKKNDRVEIALSYTPTDGVNLDDIRRSVF